MSHLLKSLKATPKREGNYLPFSRYRCWHTVRRHLSRYYSATAPVHSDFRPMVACMAADRPFTRIEFA